MSTDLSKLTPTQAKVYAKLDLERAQTALEIRKRCDMFSVSTAHAAGALRDLVAAGHAEARDGGYVKRLQQPEKT